MVDQNLSCGDNFFGGDSFVGGKIFVGVINSLAGATCFAGNTCDKGDDTESNCPRDVCTRCICSRAGTTSIAGTYNGACIGAAWTGITYAKGAYTGVTSDKNVCVESVNAVEYSKIHLQSFQFSEMKLFGTWLEIRVGA